jgi:hypothetical protein
LVFVVQNSSVVQNSFIKRARLIQIKRARERLLVRNTRARVGFADGSLKVLGKFCGQNLITKSVHKKGRQTPKYVPHHVVQS